LLVLLLLSDSGGDLVLEVTSIARAMTAAALAASSGLIWPSAICLTIAAIAAFASVNVLIRGRSRIGRARDIRRAAGTGK
jgi:hypothetical protein